MPSSHLILCRPFLLLPPIPPSIRVFSNESTHRMRWPKYWSFSFSISPSKEYPELISFRMDWLDLLAVQGTLKSLLQHHHSKASIFQCSTFFTVQLSHPYITTGKTIALTRETFVGKVMSLRKLKQSVHEQFSHRHVRRLDLRVQVLTDGYSLRYWGGCCTESHSLAALGPWGIFLGTCYGCSYFHRWIHINSPPWPPKDCWGKAWETGINSDIRFSYKSP